MCRGGVRIDKRGEALGRGDPRELRRELGAPPAHRVLQIVRHVDEEAPRLSRTHLLPLEQHRQRGPEQQHGGQRAQRRRIDEVHEALAVAEVGDLVVILEEVDEPLASVSARRGAARLALPGEHLTLVEKAAHQRRDQLLRRAAIVAEVAVDEPGRGDARRVVEVVVPQRIEPELEQVGFLRFVLADEEQLALAGRLACPARELADDVVRAGVEDRLDRVEPQAIEVELGDPVRRVLHDILAHRGLVEREPVAPLAALGVPVQRRPLEHRVAGGAEVVVDDVEDHGEAERVRAVDEPPQVVRRAVVVGGRVEVHAVVAPVVAAGALGERHHLDRRDPDVGEVGQGARGRLPRALGRERPDVQLVEDVAIARDASPARVGPRERARLDDLRGPERPLGLIARRRIRHQRRRIAEAKAVARPGAHVGDEACVVAAVLVSEHHLARARRLLDEGHARMRRGPHACVNTALAAGGLHADRHPPRGAHDVTSCSACATRRGRVRSR